MSSSSLTLSALLMGVLIVETASLAISCCTFSSAFLSFVSFLSPEQEIKNTVVKKRSNVFKKIEFFIVILGFDRVVEKLERGLMYLIVDIGPAKSMEMAN